MKPLTIITMILIVGLVWGGLVYIIALAAKYEKKKKREDQ